MPKRNRPGQIFAKVLMFLFLSVPLAVLAQDRESRTKREIDALLEDHPYRIGKLRVGLRFEAGTGYDTNALSGFDEEVGDYFVQVTPGISAAFRLTSSAYITLMQDLTFLYYRDLDQLRDIYNTTSVKFIAGSSRLFFDAGASYLTKKARVSSEFDIPAQQETVEGKAGVTYAIRHRTDLLFHFYGGQSLFQEDESISSAPPPQDRRILEFTIGLDQKFGRGISILGDGLIGKTDFLSREPGGITSTSNRWKVMGGFGFYRKRIIGRTKIGYGQTEDIASDSTLKDFLVDVDLTYRFRKRLTAGILATRDRYVSDLVQDSFRLTTEIGVQGSIPLTARFFLDGEFSGGKNDYSNQLEVDDQVVRKDDFRRAEFGLNVVLIKSLIFRGGFAYYDRESNVQELTKSRTTLVLGVYLEL